ncbi:MAG: hemolysin III family protein [Actinomycetota bacterium]
MSPARNQTTLVARATAPVWSVADGKLRPRWRGRLHGLGFVLSLTAAPILVLAADSVAASVGLAVYALSLMALFGTSAAYHLLARTEKTQRLMRRADHSMIFVMIAGTYTPVCLLALPRSWGIPILVTIWVAAASGVAIKLLAGPWLLRISNLLYLLLGWIAIGALPVILRYLTTTEFTLLAIGGVLYTIGAILFALRVPRLVPSTFGYHEVWHGFTVLAAMAHFAMVWSVAI